MSTQFKYFSISLNVFSSYFTIPYTPCIPLPLTKNSTIQDSIQNGLHSPSPLVCNSLKTIGVRKYLDVCSLMDIPCALHNDWTGLAGEVGLTVDEVFKIQSKACFPNFSPTNEVLNIWSQRQSKSCNIDEFKVMLKNLQRFDVLETLEEPDS